MNNTRILFKLSKFFKKIFQTSRYNIQFIGEFLSCEKLRTARINISYNRLIARTKLLQASVIIQSFEEFPSNEIPNPGQISYPIIILPWLLYQISTHVSSTIICPSSTTFRNCQGDEIEARNRTESKIMQLDCYCSDTLSTTEKGIGEWWFRLSVFSGWINYTGYGGCFKLRFRIPFSRWFLPRNAHPAKINNLLVNTLRSQQRERLVNSTLWDTFFVWEEGMKHSNFPFNLGINEEERGWNSIRDGELSCQAWFEFERELLTIISIKEIIHNNYFSLEKFIFRVLATTEKLYLKI